jgi:hypothetical protein
MRTPVQIAEEGYAQLGARVELWPFSYAARMNTPVAAGVVTDLTISIDNDSDFVWMQSSFLNYNTLAADQEQPRAQTLVSVQISLSGRTITESLASSTAGGVQNTVYAKEQFGWSAEEPFVLYEPIIVPARSAVNLRVLAWEGSAFGNPGEIEFTLHGAKAYWPVP